MDIRQADEEYVADAINRSWKEVLCDVNKWWTNGVYWRSFGYKFGASLMFQFLKWAIPPILTAHYVHWLNK